MAQKQTKNVSYEGFTLTLALVDALPVLFFGGSSIILGLLFQSPLFLVGACLIFLGGFGKVLWKLILAAKKQDVVLLNRQMKYTMSVGFLCVILSVILGRKRLNGAAILAGLTSLPSLIFFILGLCGMVTMGVLAKKLDSSVAKNNWIEQCVNGCAQLCIFLGLLFLL